MENTGFTTEYFKEKINSMRLKLRRAEGFEPLEKISETLKEPDEPAVVLTVKTSEKVNA